MLRCLRSLVLNILRRSRLERDMADELRFHIEARTADLVALGFTSDDAQRRAHLEFGSVERYQGECREARGLLVLDQLQGNIQHMANFTRDVKQAWRVVRFHPWSSGIAIALLAVAIGANGAIFSLINAVMLQPLPVPEPERLVSFGQHRFSYRQFDELRRRVDSFESLFAWSPQNVAVGWGDRADRTAAFVVSGEFFSGLGVRPVIGRLLLPDDDAPTGGGDGPVAVLGYNAWSRRFSADPAVLGRRILIENVPFAIIGVAPREFHGVAPGLNPEIYIPATSFAGARTESTEAFLRSPGFAWLHLMARLDAGVTLDRALGELRIKWPQLLAEIVSPQLPTGARERFLARTVQLVPAPTGESRLRQEFSTPLLLLMGLVALVLVAACANIANVLLARASMRRPELATRLALGAGRSSLFTQLIAEAAICALASATIGVFLASVGADMIVRLASTTASPVALNLSPDWRFSLFTSAIALFCAVTCGLAAALQITRIDPVVALREEGRGDSSSVRHSWTRKALVIGQVAASVMLLIGAGLLVRSLLNLLSTNLGFTAEGLILVHSDLRTPDRGAGGAARNYEEAASIIARLPGVQSTSLALVPPISLTDGYWTRELKVDGQLQTLEGNEPVFFNVVGPNFLRTRGIRILQGRGLTTADEERAPRVVVVNETLAKRYLGSRDALGRHVSIGGSDARQNLQIIGIAEDATYQTIQEPRRATAYLPYPQDPKTADTSAFTIEVRVAGESDSLRTLIEQELRRRNPTVPVTVEAVPTRIQETLWKERLLAGTSTGLGLLALLVAGAGVAGIMARSVTQRWRELGIRMALGATANSIIRMVVGEAIILVFIGAAIGAASALIGGHYVATLLYGITPSDLRTAAAACGLMLTVGVLAAYVPARRVLSLDPATSIREP